MPRDLNPIKNSALEYLKKYSSTEELHIKTVGQFFIYLKDSILSLFNTDHKFAYLGNKSIAEFNLEHIQKDLDKFLKNPSLNNFQNKNKKEYLEYTFQYLSTQAGILPNFYDIYHSGSIDPNELISQLINYGKKLTKEELNDREQKHKDIIEKILSDIKTYLLQKNISDTVTLIEKISSITNT